MSTCSALHRRAVCVPSKHNDMRHSRRIDVYCNRMVSLAHSKLLTQGCKATARTSFASIELCTPYYGHSCHRPATKADMHFTILSYWPQQWHDWNFVHDIQVCKQRMWMRLRYYNDTNIDVTALFEAELSCVTCCAACPYAAVACSPVYMHHHMQLK